MKTRYLFVVAVSIALFLLIGCVSEAQPKPPLNITEKNGSVTVTNLTNTQTLNTSAKVCACIRGMNRCNETIDGKLVRSVRGRC